MRLFDEPLTAAQHEEYAYLLDNDKVFDENLTEEERPRMKELV